MNTTESSRIKVTGSTLGWAAPIFLAGINCSYPIYKVAEKIGGLFAKCIKLPPGFVETAAEISLSTIVLKCIDYLPADEFLKIAFKCGLIAATIAFTSSQGINSTGTKNKQVYKILAFPSASAGISAAIGLGLGTESAIPALLGGGTASFGISHICAKVMEKKRIFR